MTDGILDRRRQLRRSAVVGGNEEHRVVAKTVAATRLGDDVPVPAALGNDRDRARISG